MILLKYYVNRYRHTLEQDESLSDIYNKLDDMCSLDNNQQYCAKGKDEYVGFDNAKKLYYNLHGNKVKYDYSNPDFAKFHDYPQKFCFFLKYWLYDKIIFNKFDGNVITEVLSALKSGNKFEIFMTNNYTCSFDILELEKIQEIKLFYDYIASYDNANKKSSIHYKICGSKYEETLNKTIGLYNERYRNGGNKSNLYSNEFDECKEVYKIDMLCKLKCNSEEPFSVDETDSVCSQVVLLPQPSSADGSSDEELQQNLALGDTENPSIGITMTVVPTLIALFVIFPILYKLTPFGPWLHKSVIKTKNFLLNPNENSTDTLLNHMSESDSGNFMERSHYITYHSS
ncbi:PIR Superfamily Protein [Plasmodium ovale wallikeri]|uniref:PIR Superfamily Protein n=1 Tax=Plasmodium ovale wallikeri TaxID=864142 RepID=A0A1A9AQF5_PLAOA|nr:PIR Superfamily Protein [Plasmodium ovale wallikeri]